jgi:hypothetical protein
MPRDGSSRVTDATHARESGVHINLDKVEGAYGAKDPRSGRSNSLKLRDEQAIDNLQRELDAAREALREE